MLSNFCWWQISTDFFSHTERKRNKQTNIRVINIFVYFCNGRRYFFFCQKSNRRERNQHGNEEFTTETKPCLNVSKHHFSVFSVLIKHTERERDYDLFFFIFLLRLFVFFFCRSPIPQTIRLPPFCVSIQTLVCVFFIRFSIPFIWIIVAFLYFYPSFFSHSFPIFIQITIYNQ